MDPRRLSSICPWFALGASLALSTVACGDGDSPRDASVSDAPVGDFDTCIAEVEPVCVLSDAETAEDIETACFDLTTIPIPLTDGSVYPAETVAGGPYGGRVDWNVGADTEFVNAVNVGEPVCPTIGVQTFQEPDEVNQELIDTRGLDHSLYTIFRPACMKEGETYPVITWANGTCGFTHGYAPLLGAVASHGFVVIASNSTWTNTSPTNGVQLRALDYAEALNADPESPLYQRLDLERVGAMGHSQGAAATQNAASDPRVKAVILWNGGASDDKPFLNVSGERDTYESTPESMAAEGEAASQPGAWVYYHQILETGGHSTGHLVLMEQPTRVTEMAVAWWKYILNDDAEAAKMFEGDDCGLCNSADELSYGVNGLF